MKTKLNHPMADQISIIDHDRAYAGRGSKEIAFFSNGEWVTDIIEEFADYTSPEPDGDTRVYGYVPVALVDDFMETYRA